jgi:hypothetical protein
MLNLNFDYKTVVKNSERVEWRLDDVLPEGTRLDFTRMFLPPVLVPGSALSFLDDAQQRIRNHITSNAYANLFAFVEEYIIAMALQHAHAETFGDHDAIRALCRFADEETKHQALFLRYCAAFNRDFGHKCDVLGSAAEVAGVILSKSPLAVMLVTLHLELITQQHYTDSVKDNAAIDPLFAKLLKAHWLEESQHARIDQLELQKMAAASTPEQIQKALSDYSDLLGAFDGLLKSQAEMDAATFERATGRSLKEGERSAFVDVQHVNYRGLFLTSGLKHATFVETLDALDAGGKQRAANLAATYA